MKFTYLFRFYITRVPVTRITSGQICYIVYKNTGFRFNKKLIFSICFF